jgi:D-alanyl-D-alanine carboxypeptidase
MGKIIKTALIAISIILVCCLGIGVLTYRPLSDSDIEKVGDNAREIWDIPAVSIEVMDSETVRYSYIDGSRRAGSDDRVTGEDYFFIGSCSKSILACIAAKLAEEGKITWDTRFFDLFPELKAEADQAYYDITLEDLLQCQAGIQPFTSGLEEFPQTGPSEDRRDVFFKYLLGSEPSSKKENGKFAFLYSNASYSLANAMLERASGMNWESLLDTYIANELGIGFIIGPPYLHDENQPRGHYVYSPEQRKMTGYRFEMIGPEAGYALDPLIYPAGNLSMKPGDFSKYIRLHLEGLQGKSTFLTKESFASLYRDTGAGENGETYTFGSWDGAMLGKKYSCIEGTDSTFYARGLIVPEEDFGMTIMMNCGCPEAVEYITLKLAKARFGWWWMFWV